MSNPSDQTSQPALTPERLDDIERALLGVLCAGLPPARLAGDDGFRVDVVTARVLGRLEDAPERHVEGGDRDDAGVRVSDAFRARLRDAIASLTEAGVLAEQPAGMPAAPGGYEDGIALDVVEPDAHPTVLDRHLAQECMEALFRVKAVYPYLMERYSASGEVWRRLRADGYAS